VTLNYTQAFFRFLIAVECIRCFTVRLRGYNIRFVDDLFCLGKTVCGGTLFPRAALLSGLLTPDIRLLPLTCFAGNIANRDYAHCIDV